MRRTRKVTLVAGTTGTARVGRRFDDLLERLRPGDIALVDQDDLDDDQLTALVEAGVAGVVLVGHLSDDELDRLEDDADGTTVQLHAGVVHVAGPDGSQAVLARGHRVDLDDARAAAAVDPEPDPEPPSDHDPSRPEAPSSSVEDLELRTELSGRPVVVVDAADHTELRTMRGFVRDVGPALIAVGRAADDLLSNSWAPDVVVVAAGDPDSMPSNDSLRVVTDVILLVSGDAGADEVADLGELGITPHVLETPASAQRVALRVAQRYAGDVVVTIGIDPEPVDTVPVVSADTVRALTGADNSSRTLAVVLLVGLVALLLAVAVTPVGHDWLDSIGDTLGGLL